MMLKISRGIMRVTRWLADGYKAGTPLEQNCIWPIWAVFRLASHATWWIAHQELKRKDARERCRDATQTERT